MSQPDPEQLRDVPEWAIQYDAGEFERCSYTADVVGLALDPASGTPHALVVERGREPFAGLHAWPGGFVDLARDDDSRVAALRELREETGQADAGFLEVLGVYDGNGRDPRQFAGFRDESGAWVRRGTRVVTTAHLALMRREGRTPQGGGDASAAFWAPVYDYLPWEDRRRGGAETERAFRALVEAGAAGPEAERVFGQGGSAWNEELVAERYALLHDAGLLAEARRDRWGRVADPDVGPRLGRAMAFDHRRILADAVGRIRGKVKYVPATLHALAGERFTLDELQRAVEGIAGRPLHRANFRRTVTARREPLVEPTGTYREPTHGLGVGAQEFAFRAPALPRLRTALEYPWAPLP